MGEELWPELFIVCASGKQYHTEAENEQCHQIIAAYHNSTNKWNISPKPCLAYKPSCLAAQLRAVRSTFCRQNANDFCAGSGVEIWTSCMTKSSTEGYFPCPNALLIIIKISISRPHIRCDDAYSSPSRTGPAVDCFLPTPPLPRTFASIASPKDLMQASFFSEAMSRWTLAL